MKRRAFSTLAAGAVLGAAAAARAQKTPRIGFLVAGDPEPTWTLFRKAMTDRGYIDGKSVHYDYRVADAGSGRLDGLAAELVGLKVDVLVAVLTPAIVAAKRATSRIPVVFNGGAINVGLVKNVARPEANLTGVFSPGTTLAAKAVQLFHELKPELKAFGLLLNESDPFHAPLQRDVEAVGRAEKINIVNVSLKTPRDLPAAIEDLARKGFDGCLVQPSLGLDEAAALALKFHLPAISFRREFVERGGLLSYGANQAAMNRVIATDVDKLLKGASPGDIPAQEAADFELVVNQKTATALGLVFPPLFLARVDQVIE